MLTFLQLKVKLIRFSEILLNTLISIRTSSRLGGSRTDSESENNSQYSQKPFGGVGKTVQGWQASVFSCTVNAEFLLINYLSISSQSQQQLPLLISPAVPTGKSIPTTFPSLLSAPGESGKPMGALFTRQLCCPSVYRSVVGGTDCGSLWEGEALGIVSHATG